MSNHSPVRVITVCWGNICRSPMAAVVLRQALDEAGVTEVEVTSAGTSNEELGAPIDPRAVATLERAGYRPGRHAAHQITADELAGADLVVAMEPLHVDRLSRIAGRNGSPANVALLSDFDPDASPGAGLPDPWYGPDEAFTDTLRAIEAAVPGLVDAVRQLRPVAG